MDTSDQPTTSREEDGVNQAVVDLPTAVEPPSQRSFVAKLLVNDAAYSGLSSELTVSIREFEMTVERSQAEGEPWATLGRELLQTAVGDLRRGNFNESWRHLHAAKRLEIYGLERIEEQVQDTDSASDITDERVKPSSPLQVRAATVREEALDALDGWRRQAVVDLLCDESEALRDDVTAAELSEASRILHEQYESTYLVRSEYQRQFNQLLFMGLLSGLSLFVLSLLDSTLGDAPLGFAGSMAAYLETPFGTTPPDVTAVGFAVYVALTGVMGASVSGIWSLRRHSDRTRIPPQINQRTITTGRGAIGAVSALVLYFLLQTPFLSEGTTMVDSSALASLMIAVGFAAGYSERLVPAAVAQVASLSDTDETDGPEEMTRGEAAEIYAFIYKSVVGTGAVVGGLAIAISVVLGSLPSVAVSLLATAFLVFAYRRPPGGDE
ncbi:hypothetical protein [Salinigranum salinum]|uniref:hypothetical protein n=1 Tax=Salinigranum salinum TaxID=1364937 RepID=UPI00126127CF|nr:hypothetical protein [Salinigranum salinum]